jgi:uncharacterized protein
MTARLARITLFPIKSFDGIDIDRTPILPSGALAFDRRWAFFDSNDRYINGKNRPEILRIRSTFSPPIDRITIQPETGTAHSFHLTEDQPALNHWLSTHLNQPVQLRTDPQTGFPDDPASPGPTIVSTATLETIASWYPDLTLNEIRRRFRTNLEIDGVPPFWEDQLFAPDPNQTIPFRIGPLHLVGVNPCQRCPVPTRSSLTGEKTDRFQQTFIEKRRETLPTWAAKSRFNHYYKLTINTRLAEPIEESDRIEIEVGDRIEIEP